MNATTCKFNNGSFVNTHCEAGVCYKDVTPDPDVNEGSAWRLPCSIHTDRDFQNNGQRENYERRGTCEKFQLPTDEEIAQSDAEDEARFKEVMESLEKGIVPDGVIVCGPSTIGKCVCKCPESCEHIWDGETIDEEQMSTATCSRCGMWAINHDMWIDEE